MREIKEPKHFDWDKEIVIKLSLKELAVIYAVACHDSTNDSADKVARCVVTEKGRSLNVKEGDIPYKVYTTAKKILQNNGVEVTE